MNTTAESPVPHSRGGPTLEGYMDAATRGRFQPRGWKHFDLLMLGMSIAIVLWIVMGG
jgi:hypothetical protein